MEKDGIPKMMEALDFIIAAEVKYLFMMVTFDSHKEDEVQLILYKRFLECTLIQWRLYIFP